MTEPPPDDTPPPPPAFRRASPRRKKLLGPESEIGARLREFYTELEREPIPSEIIELLERLDEVERRGAARDR
ncbi:NepR family anti-sigma factor [Amaricoccus sp.]|uniref:NepR family anti-sigma factor n=1 Tax=Amaricoccus sp. TaxID=1872485 RepID=UPI001B4DE7B7|nr:NepR family anti-sigma factor [Amaricoccus sp.]MBP7000363.1 hypothetical protein [Amaricoccus sp.]